MKGKKFIFLEHTADAKFQAFGRTLEEAFENAALALVSLMWKNGKISPEKKISVSVSGRDLKQLLVDFLEEILYVLDTKNFLLCRVEDILIEKEEEGFRLKSHFIGDSYSDDYHIFGEVKAITYDEMDILEKNGFQIQVVVDI